MKGNAMKRLGHGLVLGLTMVLSACGGGDGGENGGESANAPAEQSTVSHQRGAETPMAVIERLSVGLAADDVEAIASVLDAEPDVAGKTALLILDMHGAGDSLEAAKAKFTDAKLQEAMGFGYMLLNAMQPPFAEVAEKGEVTVTGDTARIIVKEQAGKRTSTMAMNVSRHDERWYLTMDKLPPAEKIDQVQPMMEEFRVGMADAVETSETAQEFSEKVGPLIQKLNEIE